MGCWGNSSAGAIFPGTIPLKISPKSTRGGSVVVCAFAPCANGAHVYIVWRANRHRREREKIALSCVNILEHRWIGGVGWSARLGIRLTAEFYNLYTAMDLKRGR